MRFENVTTEQQNVVIDLLSRTTQGQTNFTYFNSRDISVLKNHLVTIVGIDIESQIAVCYGHLDQENDKVWLGVFVADAWTGRGYGKKTVEELIKRGNSLGVREIHLTVYKENTTAYNLYKSVGFKVEKQDSRKYWMVWQL